MNTILPICSWLLLSDCTLTTIGTVLCCILGLYKSRNNAECISDAKANLSKPNELILFHSGCILIRRSRYSMQILSSANAAAMMSAVLHSDLVQHA